MVVSALKKKMVLLVTVRRVSMGSTVRRAVETVKELFVRMAAHAVDRLMGSLVNVESDSVEDGAK